VTQSTVPAVTLSGSALTGIAPRLLARPVAELPHVVRLGRIRPKARPLALRLAAYIDLDRLLAALPVSVDYAQKAKESISRVYLNDTYGDCVIAGKYHTVGIWSGNDQGAAVLGTDQEVLESYHTICGPGDNGCVITDVLDVFRSRGLPFGGKAHRIDGYVSCDWRNQDLVRAALYLFGNLTLGINLPDAWTRNDLWDVTATRIVGGHDVTACGYTQQGVQIASWGRIYTITWAAFTSTKWLEEAYCLLGPDWYNDDQLSPLGLNVQTLKDDLTKISGGQVPPIDPGPAPPVPPVPPPTPPPGPAPVPAPAPLFYLTFARDVPKGSRVGGFIAKTKIPAGKYGLTPAVAGEVAETHTPEVSES
jgi:hypothetical protein